MHIFFDTEVQKKDIQNYLLKYQKCINIILITCYYNWKILKRIEKRKWSYWILICLMGIVYIISMASIINAIKNITTEIDITNRYFGIILGIITLSVSEITILILRYGMRTIMNVKFHVYPFSNWLKIIINQCSIMINEKIFLLSLFGFFIIIVLRTHFEITSIIVFIGFIYLSIGNILALVGILNQLMKRKLEKLNESTIYQIISSMGVFLSLIPIIATKEIFYKITVSTPMLKNIIFGIQAIILNDWISVLWNLFYLSLYFGIGIIIYISTEYILHNK
ncbi:MAG: hypothetical protein J4F36_14235 [Nitrosopumilaceae archaeon]|nr:hypothetical protein [Nitrosopumilaceae archaeon]